MSCVVVVTPSMGRTRCELPLSVGGGDTTGNVCDRCRCERCLPLAGPEIVSSGPDFPFRTRAVGSGPDFPFRTRVVRWLAEGLVVLWPLVGPASVVAVRPRTVVPGVPSGATSVEAILI